MNKPKVLLIHPDPLAAESLASRLNAWPLQAWTINTPSQDTDGFLKDLWLNKPDVVLINTMEGVSNWKDLAQFIKADEELSDVRVFTFGDQDLAQNHPAVDRHVGWPDAEPENFPAILAKVIIKSLQKENVS
jgi:hypothetical protein